MFLDDRQDNWLFQRFSLNLFQEMFVSREMILFFPFFLLFRSFIGEVAGVSFAVKKMIYIILYENDMPFIDFVICGRIDGLL